MRRSLAGSAPRRIENLLGQAGGIAHSAKNTREGKRPIRRKPTKCYLMPISFSKPQHSVKQQPAVASGIVDDVAAVGPGESQVDLRILEQAKA